MSPSEGTPIKCGEDHYQLICTLEATGKIPVHKYKSALTGITVVVAEVEGPLVNGYFCLATEAHDDDGLPHTLEHLVFLGSEQYPYKGVLDLLANRCLASGTNAWTDVDHTCYTLTTAGSEGFLTLLPIYLDHILYPTLTESGFITEVHHVKGEGEDAGVVYCEMQARENTGESRCCLALLRELYPGDCGYRYETGGILKNLRESTTIEKVRNYHRQFYTPENLTVIVTGKVVPADVFGALKSFEEKVYAKGPREVFNRPWESAVPPLTQSADLTVPYPCDEEDNGMVYVAWRGPSAVMELYELLACSMLMKYMTETAVSPLQKEFVENDDPMASKVGSCVIENSESALYLEFENVPVQKLEKVKPALDQMLRDFAEGKQRFNMKRMRTILRRTALEVFLNIEKKPHDTVAFAVIGDMLYGHTVEDLERRLNQIPDLHDMERELEPFWVDMLVKYFVNAPCVTVKGMPSIEEQRAVALFNKNLVEEQKTKLGEAGLQVKAEELCRAIQENERPVPNELLTSVKIPSTESIHYHSLVSYAPESDRQHPDFNLKDLPIQVYMDDVRTNFVHIHVLMDTSEVPLDKRQYLPLVLESLLELPVQRGDELVPYEDIVAQLEKDTVSASTNLGIGSTPRFQCGGYSHTAVLNLMIEPTKYERGLIWVKELLYKTRFSEERVRVIAAKMANDVAQAKRRGSQVTSDLMRGLRYRNDSNHHAASMLRQHKFLTSLIQKMESNEEQTRILADVDFVRNVLIRPHNLAAHLAFDVMRTTFEGTFDPEDLWMDLIPEITAKRKPLHVTPDSALLIPPEEGSEGSCVVGLGCIDSSFLCRTIPSISDFNHEDLPALLVFTQYLTQLEGPLWKQIRGMGLSYGYSILCNPNEGLLYFTLYRSSNCVEAFREAKKIINSYLTAEVNWDQTLFESARSSLIFEIIEREKSIDKVVAQSLLSYFQNTSHSYNSYMVDKVANVTIADLDHIGSKYITPLFDPACSKTTIVCHPSAVDEILNGFSEEGETLKVYQSLEDTFLNY